jgi:hypothetical protein
MTRCFTPLYRTTIALGLLLLSACQSGVYLMPTPVGIQAGKHDPFTNTPKNDRSSDITVAYGTNRLPADSEDFYGRQFDENLRMGIVRMKIGEGGQSWEEIHRLSTQGLDKKDARLSITDVSQNGEFDSDSSLDKLPEELQTMFHNFNVALDHSPVDEITIYVHGANNTFYRTAAQAAQYRHFTGRNAVVAFFSWPSAESILRYGTDVSNIMDTVPTFARFIKLLATHSTAKRINILCYSVGATLTTKTLAMLGNDKTQSDRVAYRKSLRLGSIYFAAPDTDFDDFIEEYRSYQDIVDRVTVTINPDDSVLGISRSLFHAKGGPKLNNQNKLSSKSRLGKPDVEDLTDSQLEWIIIQTQKPNFDILEVDYNAIPDLPKGSHDYWYQNPWTSTDALLALNYHTPPGKRGLVMRDGIKGARIWYFPNDYDRRVNLAIDSIVGRP